MIVHVCVCSNYIQLPPLASLGNNCYEKTGFRPGKPLTTGSTDSSYSVLSGRRLVKVLTYDDGLGGMTYLTYDGTMRKHVHLSPALLH